MLNYTLLRSYYQKMAYTENHFEFIH